MLSAEKREIEKAETPNYAAVEGRESRARRERRAEQMRVEQKETKLTKEGLRVGQAACVQPGVEN